MMVSALSAVIIWRVLGLNEAIFESIPGMGAAFIAHFLLVKFRSEEGTSPFGRFDIPDKNKLVTFGAIFLVAFAISETTYLVLRSERYRRQQSSDYEYEPNHFLVRC